MVSREINRCKEQQPIQRRWRPRNEATDGYHTTQEEKENKRQGGRSLRDSLVIADACDVQAGHREPVHGLVRDQENGRVGESVVAGPLADLAVAAVSPLALLPVVLDGLCLGALLVVARVVQGVFQAALAALTQAEEQEGADGHDTDRGRSYEDPDVGAGA